MTAADELLREAARQRLLTALPYFRNAVADALKEGPAKLAVITQIPNGEGGTTPKAVMAFDGAEFFEDLAVVLGAAPHTEEDDFKARALQFLQKHGIRNAGD